MNWCLHIARERDLDFTLLTPSVSDAGISELRPLFQLLDRHENCEVVFNDWGVLNLLRREFPNLSPAQCDSYTAFLSRLGVNTIEMDNLPQGNDLSFAESGMMIGVYLPFGFISASRICMAAGLHYHKRDKFQLRLRLHVLLQSR